MLETSEAIEKFVWKTVHATGAVDIYTELQLPSSDNQELSFDELLCCDQLRESLFKRNPRCLENPTRMLSQKAYDEIPVPVRADLIWHRLFLAHSPINDISRKVLTSLGLCGCAPDNRSVDIYRDFCKSHSGEDLTAKAVKAANLRQISLKQCVLDEEISEFPAEYGGAQVLGGLSFERLSADWSEGCSALKKRGLKIKKSLDKVSCAELIGFFEQVFWSVNARFVSMKIDEADFTNKKAGVTRLLSKCVLPLCHDLQVPLVLRFTGKSSLAGFTSIYSEFSEVKLVVSSDCPAQLGELLRLSIVPDYARMQIFMGLGLTTSEAEQFYKVSLEKTGFEFTPCASLADHPLLLAGIWAHTRWVLGKVLIEKYTDLLRTGWKITEDEVQRNIYYLLGGNLDFAEPGTREKPVE